MPHPTPPLKWAETGLPTSLGSLIYSNVVGMLSCSKFFQANLLACCRQCAHSFVKTISYASKRSLLDFCLPYSPILSNAGTVGLPDPNYIQRYTSALSLQQLTELLTGTELSRAFKTQDMASDPAEALSATSPPSLA